MFTVSSSKRWNLVGDPQLPAPGGDSATPGEQPRPPLSQPASRAPPEALPQVPGCEGCM